jgi:CHAT domain-containing protein
MLMRTKYSLLQEDSKLPKSEGLRQAQVSIAAVVLRQDTMVEAGPGLEHQMLGNDWKQSFYWVPFILIGKWN